MPRYRRGDVLVAHVPVRDGSLKARPVLVVQNNALKTGVPQQMVAYITSVPRSGKSRVAVSMASKAGKQMGLLFDSVILADVLTTLPQEKIKKKIGSCPLMEQVDDALRAALAL